MKKITNHFLIALPNMADPIFKKSIIYICEHNIEGYMGVIINKPISKNNISDILKQMNLLNINNISNVYFGGPVEINRGLVLHSNNYQKEGTTKISKNISLTSNDEILNDINLKKGPIDYKFIVGYSGWGPGQLEKEIENGDWLLISLDEKCIFDFSNHKKWEQIFLDLGLDLDMFTGGNSGIS